MRIKKNFNRGLAADPIPNSQEIGIGIGICITRIAWWTVRSITKYMRSWKWKGWQHLRIVAKCCSHGFKSRTSLNFFSGLISTTSSAVFITARINSIFVSSTTVHTWFSYVYSHYSPLRRFIWIQHKDQLRPGLLAQLVEHCTSITEVMGSHPVWAWAFFRPYFNY